MINDYAELIKWEQKPLVETLVSIKSSTEAKKLNSAIAPRNAGVAFAYSLSPSLEMLHPEGEAYVQRSKVSRIFALTVIM